MLVPVRRFWSSQRDITLEEVVAAIEGRSDEIRRVVVATADADAGPLGPTSRQRGPMAPT